MLIFCDLRVSACLTSGHTQLSLSFVAFPRLVPPAGLQRFRFADRAAPLLGRLGRSGLARPLGAWQPFGGCPPLLTPDDGLIEAPVHERQQREQVKRVGFGDAPVAGRSRRVGRGVAEGAKHSAQQIREA